jgi:hypothetical protein
MRGVLDMGRMLGAFDDDQELDRPDLNKCPDCNCFFAGDNCPICTKVCPEHMRAGNRAPVKPQKKKKRSSGSGRVTFVEWYHSWWFIVIMMFFFPIVGIVLLITSPHDRSKKILFVTIAAIYLVISTIGLGTIISGVANLFDKPVDTSLSKEDYIASCEDISAEAYYRSAEGYEDKFITLKLRVVSRVEYYDGLLGVSEDAYYLCEAVGGSSYKIIVRDCLVDAKQNFIGGDIITLYGEGDENIFVYGLGEDYTEWEGPCINMAYVLFE